MAEEPLDFTAIIGNIDKIKASKAPKDKKPSTSAKPFHFDTSPEDSELKAALIERINSQNYTYADIYAFCTDLKNGDIVEGQRLGYNIISGLKKRHTMIDTTFMMLCNFLGLEVRLTKRRGSSLDKSSDKKEEGK